MTRPFLYILAWLCLATFAQAQNRVLHLDGAGDYVELPANVFNHLEEATIEAWVWWEDFGYASHWFSYGSAFHGMGGGPFIMGISRLEYESKLNFYLFNGQRQRAQVDCILPRGRWVHMAAVTGRGGMKLFLNGALVAEHPFAGSFSALQPAKDKGEEFFLGRSSWRSNRDFKGRLDEVRVWSVARTPGQIGTAMYQKLNGDEPGLAALWNFDGGDGNDAGPGGYHGRLRGQARCLEDSLPGADGVFGPLTLSGRVVDPSGKPQSSSGLHFEKDGARIGGTKTAADGTYRILLFEPGPYDIKVHVADMARWHTDLLVEGTGPVRQDFTVRPANGLAGAVRAFNESPLADVVVEALRLADAGPVVRATAYSGVEGAFRFENLKPGAYLLRCHTAEGMRYYGTAPGRTDTLQVGAATRLGGLDFAAAPLKKGVWRRYGVFEGLRATGINHMHQSADGLLWLTSTDSGVWRFDGEVFDALDPRHGLAHKHVRHIYEDGDGILWFATQGGVSRYDGARFLPFDHPYLSTRRVNHIHQDRRGVMWFATEGDGVWSFDGTDFARLSREDGLADDKIHLIFEDDDGVLWFAGKRGIVRYDGARFLPFDAGSLVSHWVRDMHQDRQGALWFATREGVTRYADGAFTHLSFDGVPSGPLYLGQGKRRDVYDLFEDRAGNLWFATSQETVRYNGRSFVRFTQRDGLTNWRVRRMLQTRDGLLWFSTASGLSSYDPHTLLRFDEADALPAAAVAGLHLDADTLWVGTDRGVAKVVGDKVHRWVGALEKIRWRVNDIQRAADGSLWLATERDAWRLDGERLEQISVMPNTVVVRDIHRDRDGGLWFAANRGVVHRRDGAFVPLEGRIWDYRSVVQDRYGSMWFNMRGETAHRADGTQIVRRSILRQYGAVHSLYHAADGSMWVGMQRGLARVDPGQVRSERGPQGLDHAEIFAAETGTPLVQIQSMAEYRQVLYAASQSGGVALYDGQNWTALDRRDGLPSNQAKVLAADGDENLWIGTAEGLARYRRQTHPPGVRVVSVQTDSLYSAPFELGEVAVGTRATIEARAVDFRTLPFKRQYRYRIDGGPWTRATAERRFEWTPHQAGTHAIEVQAIDRDLNYSAPARVELQVVLPWYDNAWVVVPGLGTVLLLGLVSLGLGLRTARQRREAARLRQDMLEQERRVRLELERSNAQLQQADRAKSEFLANMSHEIRTPLNIMLGYAQIMGRNADIDAQARQYLKTIQDSGGHLLGLINDVLDLSKIEAGRLERQDADFDLSALVGELESMLALSCREKGLDFRVEWQREGRPLEAPSRLGVWGDSSKLRQVLINLLSNAVKFTQKGQVSLYVSLPADPQAAADYGFAVKDTGRGIPEHIQASVFEPFSQAQESRHTPGTGLGLAIARRFVELMGGTLALDSKAGDGALFSFMLRLEPARQALPQSVQLDAGRVVGLAPGFAVRALVVDDLEDNRQILASLLQSVGVEVVSVDSGEAALAHLEEHPADIVFMDIWMPGMDGLEAARRIVEKDLASRPRLVVVSASALEHERRRYMETGFDAFISKPVGADELYACLARLLQIEYQYAAADDSAFDPAAVVLPAPLWRQLRAAAADNNLTELEEGLEAVQASGAYGPQLAAELTGLIDRIDMKAVLALLDQIRHE